MNFDTFINNAKIFDDMNQHILIELFIELINEAYCRLIIDKNHYRKIVVIENGDIENYENIEKLFKIDDIFNILFQKNLFDVDHNKAIFRC